jgi:diguanylate cyclase (GGDEF)-like protein
VRGTGGRPVRYIGIFSDISTLKAHQRELEQLANYDALTRLPNRMLLSDRLQVAMAQARRSREILAVCYLDLDGFKPINDGHGHDAGDRLLVEMGARLKAAIRAGDTAARLGGDEFVLLLQGLSDRAEAEHTLARILKVVSQPCRIGEQQVAVSASAGVAFFPQEGADADTLLRQADQAMYQAKQEGRNRFHVFDPAHDQRARSRRETIARIAEAIAAGELSLHYQPKVDLRRGRVVGAEALVRWRHPQRGLLPPSEFLPLIDDHGLAARLGEWVIENALRQGERWRAAGLDLAVSVNISGQHLQQADFAERLARLLAAAPGLPPDRFELEVLETAALGDIQGVSAIMEECRRLGVSLALDDFGTGYSSLTYLKRLPANVLKIDQSFVRNMLRDREDLAIVDGIVGLTEAFRRTVIAEGVESVDHGVMLLQLGCDLAQGYGIAHPMSADALPAWVRAYTPPPAWQELAGQRGPCGDLSLLNAEVDHRRWVEELLAAIRPGSPGRLPVMAPAECSFGLWCEAQGRSAYGALPEFGGLTEAHELVHRRGQRLAELAAAGDPGDLRAEQEQLLAASADLLRLLRRIRAAAPRIAR